jgi:putative two-component system response regulator
MRVLIVDDDEFSLEILHGVLVSMGYDVESAENGQEALKKLRDEDIHLVITDWEMPLMNGLEFCRAVREQDFAGYIYIIMLTGRDGRQQKIEGLHAGADAFLVKPLNPDELLVSIKTAERILGLETRDLAMFALAKLSESRDPETGAHIERVQSYAKLLAQYLSTTENFHDQIDAEFIRLIHQTSPLHDIGKVAIPDSILLKPGPLTEGEMAIMRTHATLGAQTLEASLQRFPNVRFLQMARDIAMSHHERWAGNGYPNGLRGSEIPLAARIVALADVYDAITSRRVYREAMPHSKAKSLIVQERGLHFDPDVVEAFLQVERQFVIIRERLNDDELVKNRDDFEIEQTSGEPPREQPAERIFVVDDDDLTRDLIINFLNSLGLESSGFGDPRQALEAVDEFHPRIIISDWEMPHLDGLELCRRIRARNGNSHIHFIMLTVRTSKEELDRAFDAGVDDFLAKPFSEVELTARLRSGMRAVALYNELSNQHQSSQHLNEQLLNLNHRLESLATTDDLTGLHNRRQAMRRLEEHWSMSDRYRRPLAAISLDIDHFKHINDRHGHAAGDMVLREVAEILKRCVRSTDIVCRVGGEEFLIILPFQTVPEAELSAQRCRQAVMAKEFNYNGQALRTTLSAGIASRRGEMLCCADLLAEADEALYAAKRAGRNNVQISKGAQSLVPGAEVHAAEVPAA